MNIYKNKPFFFTIVFDFSFRYLQYANITAQALRQMLKTDLKVVAEKRGEHVLKMAKCEKGVQGPNVRRFHYVFFLLFHVILKTSFLLTLTLCLSFLFFFLISLVIRN